MTEAARYPARIPSDQVEYLIATATRAPSIHNTQPWRFRVGEHAIDLYADLRRKLRIDPLGREMLISCGAALFGLRLAVRSLGYTPVVQLLPDPAQLRLLARVGLGDERPVTAAERQMLAALPHRHTHRGPFAPGPLPAGLASGLQHDARAEGATLVFVDRALAYERLADILGAVGPRQDLDARARHDMLQWTRPESAHAKDGVPASAFSASSDRLRGRLRQRDFDLGRGIGVVPGDGPPPAATVVLLTPGDSRGDWLCAGQALHRLLAHAASKWVFASMHTQSLEAAAIRALIRDRLALPGSVQMILQLGPVHSTQVTARRPAADVIDPAAGSA